MAFQLISAVLSLATSACFCQSRSHILIRLATAQNLVIGQLAMQQLHTLQYTVHISNSRRKFTVFLLATMVKELTGSGNQLALIYDCRNCDQLHVEMCPAIDFKLPPTKKLTRHTDKHIN